MSTNPSRHSTRRSLPAALLGLSVLALAACGSGSGDAEAASTDGGELVVALDSGVECLDPIQTDRPGEHNIYRQLVETLTSLDPDTGELRPWLAESWDVNDDATEFSFTLRQGVTFSDGTALTAEVVKQNLDLNATFDQAVRAPSYLQGYEGTTVADEQTFTVAFSEPNASFLNRTSSDFLAILAPASLEASPESRCSEGIVGTGPFTLESYAENQEAVLTRRDDYDSAPEWAAHSGPAKLETITFSIVPESSSRLGLLTSGQAQIVQSVESQDFEAATASGAAIDQRVTPGVPLRLQVNTQEGPLQDEKVRLAVLLYLDRDEIADVVYGAEGIVANSLLTPNVPGTLDQPEALATDPAAADALLIAAGWAKGDDGIWAKDGERLAFHITKASPYSLSAPLLELVGQQLRAHGVETDFADFTGDFLELTANHAYEVLFSNTTDIDPDVLRGQVSPLQGNRSNLPEDDPLTAPLSEQNQIGDPDARAGILAGVQEEIIARALQIPIAPLVQFYGVSPSVTGVSYDVESRVYLYDAELVG